jgi:N-acyl homoserine lactone hydrolase
MLAPHPLHAQYYPRELYEGWKVRLIKGDYQLFPGLTILHTPGHTPGTQSPVVDTKEGKTVIPGFCSTFHTFETPSKVLPQGHPFAAWETFVPAIATDLCGTYNSTLRLKNIADVLYPCHGPGFDERTKPPPLSSPLKGEDVNLVPSPLVGEGRVRGPISTLI